MSTPNSPHWETLKQVIIEQLDVEESEIKTDASFTEDLNADSLDLVELIMALEEKFNLKISDEDARNIKTVGAALEYIDEHAQ
jgi:acyl carrier protein